jgi:hypothetical protein
MRRLTRLTNAFSKKWDNLRAATALHFAYYNFCKVHGTIRRTPAMASGLTDHALGPVRIVRLTNASVSTTPARTDCPIKCVGTIGSFFP